VRAPVIPGLFAGLPVNEIARLRVGCARWQHCDVTDSGTNETLPDGVVCFLEVPVNKTGGEFTKPVDRLVCGAISASDNVRPSQSKLSDWQTGDWSIFRLSME
jgi:hypothetical protein